MSDLDVCTDCDATYSIDDGCEPTDPPLCHACEKERLRGELADLRPIIDALVEHALYPTSEEARQTLAAYRERKR